MGASLVDAPPGTSGGTTAPSPTDDRAILDAVRGGDNDAFGALYSRHVAAVRRLARRMARDQFEADDIVSDVFANTLRAIRRGRGPRDDAQAYLLRSVRHTAGKLRSRKDTGRSEPVPIDRLDRAVDGDVHLRSDIEIALTHLPERHRDVLWATCVEGRPASEVAAAGGLDSSCVTSLALRARRALGRSYLLQRTTRPEPTDQCHRLRSTMPGCLRDEVSASTATAVYDHVDACEPCREVFDEMGDLDRSMCSVTMIGLLIAVVRGWLRFGSPLAAVLTKPLAAAVVAGAVVTGAITVELASGSREYPEVDAGSSTTARQAALRRASLAAPATNAVAGDVTTNRSSPTAASLQLPSGDDPTSGDVLPPTGLTRRPTTDPSPTGLASVEPFGPALTPDFPPIDAMVAEPTPDLIVPAPPAPVGTSLRDVATGATDLSALTGITSTVTETVLQVETIATTLVVEATAAVGETLDEAADGAAQIAAQIGTVADDVGTFAEPVAEVIDDAVTVTVTNDDDPLPLLVPDVLPGEAADVVDELADATVGSLFGALGSGLTVNED